ncbi:MAG: ectonucleotide pyrophosphatase/phosphodiesterase [Opitutus sp.]|nr:ectonucleotide pyrophosphatase/phosphodiesterase [Opitutus sp.]
MRTKILAFLASALLAATATAQTAVPVAAPQRPIPEVKHVMLVSVDGLRPDRLLLADTPVLRSLIRNGAYTFWARTTAVSITLPSHTSMVTGVKPDKHGIVWNWDLKVAEPIYPRVPTVMEMATKAGYSTAMIAGKSKFSFLNKPGTITYASVPEPGKGDGNEVVVENARRIVLEHKPDFAFVHFPDVDSKGHALGWGRPEQLAKIEETDAQLGRVLAAYDEAGILSSTVVIISADHGGAGLSHGADDPRSRHIPWIISGPGVRRGADLTQQASLEVNTEDSAATICWLLGLRQQPYFDGKPVYAAFEPRKNGAAGTSGEAGN